MNSINDLVQAAAIRERILGEINAKYGKHVSPEDLTLTDLATMATFDEIIASLPNYQPKNGKAPFRKVSFDWLCGAMKNRKRVGIHTLEGLTEVGIIEGIYREDGSGNCWIIKINNKELFVKTF